MSDTGPVRGIQIYPERFVDRPQTLLDTGDGDGWQVHEIAAGHLAMVTAPRTGSVPRHF